MKKLSLFLLLALSFGLSACAGDDPVTVDPNAGRRATISAFYAHPDVPAASINVSVNDSIVIQGLGYGQFASGNAKVGDKMKIRFQGLSGTELATTGETRIDTGYSTWAVYSGLGTSADDEAFAISTKMTKVAAPLAGVRFINASKNAPKVQVKLDVAAGSTLTSNFIEYKKSNDAFTPVNTSTTALVMVNESGTAVATLPLTGAAALVPGKLYTVIMYGNANNTGTNDLTVAIKLEPNQ